MQMRSGRWKTSPQSPIRNYLSDLRQFMAWCEAYWREEWNEATFYPTTVAPPLLIRYRAYFQTTLWLKPSSSQPSDYES